MNSARYVSLGRLIVDILGQDKEVAYHGGCPIINARVYQDEVVEIVCAKTTLEFGLTKLDNHNPVIMVDEKGKMYRTHGEKQYLKEHLYELAKEALCAE